MIKPFIIFLTIFLSLMITNTVEKSKGLKNKSCINEVETNWLTWYRFLRSSFTKGGSTLAIYALRLQVLSTNRQLPLPKCTFPNQFSKRCAPCLRWLQGLSKRMMALNFSWCMLILNWWRSFSWPWVNFPLRQMQKKYWGFRSILFFNLHSVEHE